MADKTVPGSDLTDIGGGLAGASIPVPPPTEPLRIAAPPATRDSTLADITPAPVTFSNGKTVQFSAGLSPQLQQSALDLIGQEQAAKDNAPVTAGDYIYSATRRYPNDGPGQRMAWLDHNAGGNWMNRNIADPLNAATGDLGPAAMRMATGALAAPVDFAEQGWNVGNRAFGKGEMQAPITSQDFRKWVGAPEFADDPAAAHSGVLGTLQPFLEAVGTGSMGSKFGLAEQGGLRGALTSPVGAAAKIAKNVATNTALTGTGYIGSEGLGAAFGEPGAYLGGIAGGGLGGRLLQGFAYRGARGLAHPQATEMYESGEPLSWSVLSAPGGHGQYTAKSIESLPIAGANITRANEGVRAGVQENVHKAGELIAGGANQIPVGGPTPQSIGSNVVQSAQDAVNYHKGVQDTAWQPVNAAMNPQTPVDVAPMAAANEAATGLNQVSVPVKAAADARIQSLISQAPGGTNYDPARGPVGPLPSSTADVPWARTRNFISEINQKLGTGDTGLPEEVDIAHKEAMLDAQREGILRAGGNPAQFDAARRVSAAIQPILKKLYPLSGQPISSQTGGVPEFRQGAGEGQAATWLKSNLQSPSNLQPIIESGSPAFSQAVGHVVYGSGLQSGEASNFRAEKAPKDLDKVQPTVDALRAQNPNNPDLIEAQDRIDKAKLFGRNFVTPTSRFSLTRSLGSGYVTAEALRHLSNIGERLGGSFLKSILPAATIKGAADWMESPSTYAAMAGKPTGLADKIYSGMPRYSAINTLTKTGQPDQNQFDWRNFPLSGGLRPTSWPPLKQ